MTSATCTRCASSAARATSAFRSRKSASCWRYGTTASRASSDVKALALSRAAELRERMCACSKACAGRLEHLRRQLPRRRPAGLPNPRRARNGAIMSTNSRRNHLSGLKVRTVAGIWPGVSLRPIFAIMIAFAMLFAPFAMPTGAMAMAPADEHAQVMASEHCGDHSSDDQDSKAAGKSCCAAMCAAVAIARLTRRTARLHARPSSARPLNSSGTASWRSFPPPLHVSREVELPTRFPGDRTMKMIFGAIALALAVPAAAQTAPAAAPDAHAQHKGMDHSKHSRQA